MYSHVFVAGTFDRLHAGHDTLLTRAFDVGDRVTLGLTSDLFIQKFRSDQHIQPFTTRKKILLDWLKTHDFENRVTLIAIDDPYEPAASMDALDTLMVTPDNRSRGVEINGRRVKKGLSELTLVEVALTPAEDTKPISATRVRNGEIDPTGRLVMPDNLRPELVRPLGEVLVGDAIGSSIEKYRSGVVIAVGDMTTKTLLTAGVTPNLSIVDFHVGRKPYPYADAKFEELNVYRVQVTSGPGFIASEAIDWIKKWSAHPTEKIVIVVTGEEDLLTLPALVYAPEDSVVYYGQPAEAAWACGPDMREGMVEVVATREKKDEATSLLEKFSVD